MLNLSNVGFWDHFLCSAGILKSIFCLPPECTLHLICFSSNSSTAYWKVHGSNTTQQNHHNSGNKVVLLIESRTLQLERARPDLYFCQFRFNQCLRSKHYNHSEGILWKGNSCSSSFLANPYYTGYFSLFHLDVSSLLALFSYTNNKYSDAWMWMGWNLSKISG